MNKCRIYCQIITIGDLKKYVLNLIFVVKITQIDWKLTFCLYCLLENLSESKQTNGIIIAQTC